MEQTNQMYQIMHIVSGAVINNTKLDIDTKTKLIRSMISIGIDLKVFFEIEQKLSNHADHNELLLFLVNTASQIISTKPKHIVETNDSDSDSESTVSFKRLKRAENVLNMLTTTTSKKTLPIQKVSNNDTGPRDVVKSQTELKDYIEVFTGSDKPGGEYYFGFHLDTSRLFLIYNDKYYTVPKAETSKLYHQSLHQKAIVAFQMPVSGEPGTDERFNSYIDKAKKISYCYMNN